MSSAIRAIMLRTQSAAYRRCRHGRFWGYPRPDPSLRALSLSLCFCLSTTQSPRLYIAYGIGASLCVCANTTIRVSSNVQGRADCTSPSLSRSAPRQSKISWLVPGVGRAGWRGTGPVEAEKDPGEQGVQAEPPAGARPTRQPLNSTAPLHVWCLQRHCALITHNCGIG